jgi:ACS family hexuronate transporter-like MFS transporter
MQSPSVSPPSPVVGNYRWIVWALWFFATTVNYVDRQILSLSKPLLDQKLGWTNAQFEMSKT